MGQVLHGSAKTTHAIRGELQRSQASVASLARKYGLNEKTVLKWRKRQSVEDMPMGPKERCSTVLSPMEEAAIVALRVQARLPLDDVYITLKDVIPHLTRSSLRRCLQRHGISRLPKAGRGAVRRKIYAGHYLGHGRPPRHISDRTCLRLSSRATADQSGSGCLRRPGFTPGTP